MFFTNQIEKTYISSFFFNQFGVFESLNTLLTVLLDTSFLISQFDIDIEKEEQFVEIFLD